MSWPCVFIYKGSDKWGCFGQMDLGWRRGSWPRLLFQQEPRCWPELRNVRGWWNPADVSVQHAIWRIYHRDRKQRSYTRKKPGSQGINDIFWLRKGTLGPENYHPSLAGVPKYHVFVKAKLSICLPKTVSNSSLALSLPPPNTHSSSHPCPRPCFLTNPAESQTFCVHCFSSLCCRASL